MHATLGNRPSNNCLSTGLSPFIAPRSSGPRLILMDFMRTVKHHIHDMLPCRVQFALSGFRSPLLTGSLLLSFPAGTKMFQFPAFPLLSELLGNLWFNGCMRLAIDYHSLPCPSSAPKPSYPLYGLKSSILLSPKGCQIITVISIGGLNTSPEGLVLTSPTYQTTLVVEPMPSIFGNGFRLRCFQPLPAAA